MGCGGRVVTDWPGVQPSELFEGEDLEVAIDYRDVLGEIVQERLGNPSMDSVFPDYEPAFRGVCV